MDIICNLQPAVVGTAMTDEVKIVSRMQVDLQKSAAQVPCNLSDLAEFAPQSLKTLASREFCRKSIEIP